MMKLVILVATLFISFAINASSEVVCPSSITCDYDLGICDTPSGWVLDIGGAGEDFSNQKTIGLSKIVGYKTADKEPTYDLRCHYSYGEYSVISIYTYVQSLTGANWVFSGFGKNKAECLDVVDPTTCAGSGQYSVNIEQKSHLSQKYDTTPLTTLSSCNNSCKRKNIRVRGNATYFYCLPTSESPSGWGWVIDGNPQAALPLCECHPVNRPDGYSVSCS